MSDQSAEKKKPDYCPLFFAVSRPRLQEGLLKTETSAYKDRRQERRMNIAKVIFCLVALILLCGQAKAGKGKQFRVSGIVSDVEPNRLTIVGPKGLEYTLVPIEDFTSRVGVGRRSLPGTLLRMASTSWTVFSLRWRISLCPLM